MPPHIIRERVLAERTCLDCGHLHPKPLLVDRLLPASLVRHAGNLIDLLSDLVDTQLEHEEALAMCAAAQALLQLVETTHALHTCPSCHAASWLPRSVNAYVCSCDHAVGAGEPTRNLRVQVPTMNGSPLQYEPGDPTVYEFVPLLEVAPPIRH